MSPGSRVKPVIVFSTSDTRFYLNYMKGNNHRPYPFEFLGTSLKYIHCLKSCLARFRKNFANSNSSSPGDLNLTLPIFAQDVYSLRRKELFWKLGLLAPNGLNERAADVELDRFACGTASFSYHYIENLRQHNGRGVGLLTSYVIARTGGVKFSIELSWI